MQFHPFVIVSKRLETEGTYIFQLRPKAKTTFSFQAGQYAYLKDPQFKDPEEMHPFSIASSPLDSSHLEFCIKEYGDWTQDLLTRNIGDSLFISDAKGSFVWQEDARYAVFLLGGIGIAPIMSMLRTFVHQKKQRKLLMLYGNRTPETIAYKKELEIMQKTIPELKIIHIFSHIDESHPWKGYKGFITREIIENEVILKDRPMFYFIGPEIFVVKMKKLLLELNVDTTHMITESLK